MVCWTALCGNAAAHSRGAIAFRLPGTRLRRDGAASPTGWRWHLPCRPLVRTLAGARSTGNDCNLRGGEVCIDSPPAPTLIARPYPASGNDDRKHPCPDGGIGRRTVFRWRRSQGRGGSSPLLGTISAAANVAGGLGHRRQRSCRSRRGPLGRAMMRTRAARSSASRLGVGRFPELFCREPPPREIGAEHRHIPRQPSAPPAQIGAPARCATRKSSASSSARPGRPA